MEIRRCQHIKTNGVQCGSPALRGASVCYFHGSLGHTQHLTINQAGYYPSPSPETLTLPVLEDYETVQMAIMQVLQKLTTGHLDRKTAGLLLYGLQIASSNLRYARFDPRAETVVIDPMATHLTPLDADQWSDEDEEENYDEEDDDGECDNEEGGAEVETEEVETAAEKQRARELRWKARDERVTKTFKGRPSELELQYRLEHGMAIPDRLYDNRTKSGAETPAPDLGADAKSIPRAQRTPSPAASNRAAGVKKSSASFDVEGRASDPEPPPKSKSLFPKRQPRISDAQFFQALANLSDHRENGTPLKFPVYPARPPAERNADISARDEEEKCGAGIPARENRPPATVGIKRKT